MTSTDTEIIGDRHHDGGLTADPGGHPLADCSPDRCGLIAMTSPPSGCQHPQCEPDPTVAVAVRHPGGAVPPYLLCGFHQWTDALELTGGDDRAALALIATDTPIARPGGLRERPLLLLAADPYTGEVLTAWIDVAYSPRGLVAQVADRNTDREDMTPYQRDPGRWWLARVEHNGDGIHVDLDTAALAAVANPDGFWVDEIGVCLNLTPTATAPVPPPPLSQRRRSITERQAEQVAAALGPQAALIIANPAVVFSSHPGATPDDGIVSITTPDGRFLAELANTGLFKSPDGFGWGYPPGSAPAALARSLLTAALGPLAACLSCHGTTTVAVPDGDGEGAADYACGDCQDGIRDLPYIGYARDVLAGLHGFWTLTRGDVLAWLTALAGDPTFAGVAASAAAVAELLS
jgi:hypothetical protein